MLDGQKAVNIQVGHAATRQPCYASQNARGPCFKPGLWTLVRVVSAKDKGCLSPRSILVWTTFSAKLSVVVGLLGQALHDATARIVSPLRSSWTSTRLAAALGYVALCAGQRVRAVTE